MKDSVVNFLRNLPPVHREGWVYVLIFLLAALLLWQIYWLLGLLGLIATAWCGYFFRDPERVIPPRADAIVSPADGKVTAIEEVTPPAEMGLGTRKHKKISVFLNIFDVHINRVPCQGDIIGRYYVPGQFLNAELDKTSQLNERMNVIIRRPDNTKIGVVQIAGLLAKRIVCWKKEGEKVSRGERFGLIRFGSRVDTYLPMDADIRIGLGQHVYGGETILADLPEK